MSVDQTERQFDFVCVGSATQDVFVQSDAAKILTLSGIHEETRALCFDYGAKMDVEHIEFTTGGGATNTAVSLARLGARSSFLGKVGPDETGKLVLGELEQHGVDHSYSLIDDDRPTGYSVILTSHEGDRTVLTHRGASTELMPDEVDWSFIDQTAWLYVSSLSGDSAAMLEPLFDRAAKAGVKIAFNPGSTQLKMGLDGLADALSKAEVLTLNKHEAALLSGVEPLKDVIVEARSAACGHYVPACPRGALRRHERLAPQPLDERPSCEQCQPDCPADDIEVEAWPFNVAGALTALCKTGPKVVAVTDGGDGVLASDGEVLYRMPAIDVKVASTLGAGDAFGSAFALEYSRSGDIGRALALGSANAASVIQVVGAKNGLLAVDGGQDVLDKFDGSTLHRYKLAGVVAAGQS
jgi:sugar/nucleoside kinase (ribokinase family)